MFITVQAQSSQTALLSLSKAWLCSNSIYYQCIDCFLFLRASKKGKFPLTEGTQMAAPLLKQPFHQCKNDRYLDTLDAFLHCFQLHLLVHMGLLRTGLNILAGLYYCFHYYNHYQSSTAEEPTAIFFFFLSKTTTNTEDCWYRSSLA